MVVFVNFSFNSRKFPHNKNLNTCCVTGEAIIINIWEEGFFFFLFFFLRSLHPFFLTHGSSSLFFKMIWLHWTVAYCGANCYYVSSLCQFQEYFIKHTLLSFKMSAWLKAYFSRHANWQFYISVTPLTLTESQGHLRWHKSVVLISGCIYTKFEDILFHSL